MKKSLLCVFSFIYLTLGPQIALPQGREPIRPPSTTMERVDNVPNDEPDPLILVVRILPRGRIEFHNSRVKSAGDLTKLLTEIFEERAANRIDQREVFVVKSAKSAVVIKTVVAAVELAGASPVKVVSNDYYRRHLVRRELIQNMLDVPKLPNAILILPPANEGPAPPVNRTLKILSKPKATYTDTARKNGIQGSVILRITFLASGEIGKISTVKGLKYGLTKQATITAKSIKFEPQVRMGVAVTTVRNVEYSFTIY